MVGNAESAQEEHAGREKKGISHSQNPWFDTDCKNPEQQGHCSFRV